MHITSIRNVHYIRLRGSAVGHIGRQTRPVSRIVVETLGEVVVHLRHVRVVLGVDRRDEIEERTGILAPEITAVRTRIPVALADALEEDRQADSVPVAGKVETEAVTRRTVADDAEIAVILKGKAIVINHAVTVEVRELDMARAGHLVAGLLEALLGGGIDIGLVLEEAEDRIAPHLADLHPLIVLRLTHIVDQVRNRTEGLAVVAGELRNR